jgi:hypothetical protein
VFSTVFDETPRHPHPWIGDLEVRPQRKANPLQGIPPSAIPVPTPSGSGSSYRRLLTSFNLDFTPLSTSHLDDSPTFDVLDLCFCVCLSGFRKVFCICLASTRLDSHSQEASSFAPSTLWSCRLNPASSRLRDIEPPTTFQSTLPHSGITSTAVWPHESHIKEDYHGAATDCHTHSNA